MSQHKEKVYSAIIPHKKKSSYRGSMQERDFTQEQVEFARAMHERKIELGKMSLPWDEVLKVAKSLGYAKVEDGQEVSEEVKPKRRQKGPGRGRPRATAC